VKKSGDWAVTEVDVVVVGAGFAGLRALYGLRNLGLKVTVLEASKDVGGVWYHNGYPGARCDVESYDYSYMFSPELEQEWRWMERYAQQPEILRYIHHVVDRFDLRKDIELNARVTRAQYNEESRRWNVTTQDGRAWDARTLVLCVGQLSAPKRPSYPGQDTFGGEVYHSGEWPKHDVSFADRRVAIIGTGSSGVQMTPVIARQAKQLTVFQRTPNYSIPAANTPVSEEEDRRVKADYRARRRQALNSPSGLGFIPNKMSALEATALERELVYEAAWNRLGFGFALAYYDLLRSKPANDTAAEFIRRKIALAVEDPVIRDKLTPKDFPFGTRRPSVDSGYFQTFNRDNVKLVDLRETPIQEFTPTGIRTTQKLHELDIVIFATGFDVFTGSLLKPQIIGRGGLTLREKWSAGPITYLGVGVAGFPNLFIVVGPGSPSLLSNVLVSTEQQVQWLEGLMQHVEAQGIAEFEVTRQAEIDWVEHVNRRSKETLYPTTPSFYMGSEIPGKPHVFMPYSGGVRDYRRILEKCAAAAYEGFTFRPATQPTQKRSAG
jgi:cyclohexanone monooxygenase